MTTPNTILGSITSTIQEVIVYKDPEILSGMDASDIKQELEDAIDSDYPSYDVNYTHEAWEIVGGNDFNLNLDENPDFEGVTCSLECLRIEAQCIINQFIRDNVNDILEDIANDMEDVCETVFNLSDDDSIKMSISNNDPHGCNVYNYETEMGTCVHLDIEGEKGLTAVSGGFGNLYLSAVFNKSEA